MNVRVPFLASVVALALGFVSGAARADEPSASAPNVVIIENVPAPAAPQPVVVYDIPKPAEAPEHEVWYGEQTLLLDGASTLMFVGAGLTANSRTNASGLFALAGTVNFLFAPPIVHFAHGRIGPGFGSFALRVALPLEVAFDGLLIGAAMTSPNDNSDLGEAGAGALIGLGIGAVGASILDAALLAKYETRDVDPEAYDPNADSANDGPKKTSRAKPSPVEWAPTASPVTGGATFGVGGVF